MALFKPQAAINESVLNEGEYFLQQCPSVANYYQSLYESFLMTRDEVFLEAIYNDQFLSEDRKIAFGFSDEYDPSKSYSVSDTIYNDDIETNQAVYQGEKGNRRMVGGYANVDPDTLKRIDSTATPEFEKAAKEYSKAVSDYQNHKNQTSWISGKIRWFRSLYQKILFKIRKASISAEAEGKSGPITFLKKLAAGILGFIDKLAYRLERLTGGSKDTLNIATKNLKKTYDRD